MKRNGSALLIVLGMVAFMLVSAVAFSAYMRYSRLPSSYLRRTSSSRQLAKAALARAIDEIDRAVANNPHPGVGNYGNRNIWFGRVLCETERLSGPSNTVPVLTFEALAYIPPPLVNDVRYFSRYTPTAEWQLFDFDCGRYAFCAVDVSDYLDVNRLAADVPRSSMSSRRITLSHLFESGTEHSSAGSGALEWDEFMKKFRTPDDKTLSFKYDSLVPLVSLADLNLALGESGFGGFSSPFCKYVAGDGDFYSASGDDDYDRIRRMTFVTDSWFPNGRKDGDDLLDLNGKGQITEGALGGSGGPRSTGTSIVSIMNSSAESKGRLLSYMPVVGLASLFDYIDKDRVPISLACPVFERAPMVCGLSPDLSNVRFKLESNPQYAGKVFLDPNCTQPADPQQNTGATRDVYSVEEYKIDPASFSGCNLRTLVLYPFAHDDCVKDTSFKIDGRATFFLSLDGEPVTLRMDGTGSQDDKDKLHFVTDVDLAKKGLASGDGTICVPLDGASSDFKYASKEEDAISEIPLVNRDRIGASDVGDVFARIRYKWTQTWNDKAGVYNNQTRPPTADIDQAHCGMPPLGKDGKPSQEFLDDGSFLEVVKRGDKKVSLCMALHVRIVAGSGDDKGKTVDLVPAHILDDKVFNGIDNGSDPKVKQAFGGKRPVMRFGTGVSVEFSAAGLSAAATDQPLRSIPTAVMIADPRYNYAPESWYDAGGDITKQTWLGNNGSKDHDGDIFLATSDQGYLQSIYELAFLPMFSDLKSVGRNGPISGDLDNPDDGRTEFGKQATDAKNNDLMWRSYRCIPTKDGGRHDFEELGFTNAGTGMKINPYTDSTNVMMAAFANTPTDWRMASTNNSDVTVEEMTAKEFNAKYAWNEYSSESKFAWKDLEAISGRFMDNICPVDLRSRPTDGSYTNWKEAWDNLGWRYASDDPDHFCGVALSDKTDDLWGVDRKFLYGFWRDCFAARQQLFLVFVRAEPMMQGGEGLDQTPPQLGARAVALVWRDPSKVANDSDGINGYPHRTRILFYRQFD